MMHPLETNPTFTAKVWREDDWYVAECVEPFTVASQGRTIKEAFANLGEALELYLEPAPDYEDPGPITDEEIILSAEESFLRMDREEAEAEAAQSDSNNN